MYAAGNGEANGTRNICASAGKRTTALGLSADAKNVAGSTARISVSTPIFCQPSLTTAWTFCRWVLTVDDEEYLHARAGRRLSDAVRPACEAGRVEDLVRSVDVVLDVGVRRCERQRCGQDVGRGLAEAADDALRDGRSVDRQRQRLADPTGSARNG